MQHPRANRVMLSMDNEPSTPSTSSSSTGLAPNVASGLAWLIFPITGIVFILIEKKNEQVRFWAMQNIVVGIIAVVWNILVSILVRVPFLGWIFAILSIPVSLGFLVLWIIGLIKAFQGQTWEIPFVGDLAKKYMPKAE